jgi:hypothetical protein
MAREFYGRDLMVEEDGKTPTPSDHVEPTISAIMEQAQVFASTYSLVGGRFDDGSKMAQSNEEKADLEQMIRAALKSEGQAE